MGEPALRLFEPADARPAIALWRTTEWASVSESDSEAHIRRFLLRNPGCSQVAELQGTLVGTVLCGHDARRGYLYHLVVREDVRRRGIGRRLVDRALHALREQGIVKCHAMVMDGNPAVDRFWLPHGWCRQATGQYSRVLGETM